VVLQEIELKGIAGTWKSTLTRGQNNCDDPVGEVISGQTEIT